MNEWHENQNQSSSNFFHYYGRIDNEKNKTFFEGGEANEWFRLNKEALESQNNDTKFYRLVKRDELCLTSIEKPT